MDTRSISLNLEAIEKRKIILLATSTIYNDTIFANGLFQNVFIIYKMLDSMGYTPIFLINEKPSDIQKIPGILRHVRMINTDEVMRLPVPIFLMIEIAMSIEPNMRNTFRLIGAKIVKLYLGNILNIDIETPMFYPSVNFSHHLSGEIDEIWTSPHYKQHLEYASLINEMNGPTKIAPYVWHPCILTHDGNRSFKWKAPGPNDPLTIVILEPNISFQKSALIPLLVAEEYYRKTKQAIRVIVGNGDKFTLNPFFTKTILPTLQLHKDNKLTLTGRLTITHIMETYPSAFAICHQWNNQYNYMTMEYLHAMFPLIHNAPDWSDAGYYYKDSDIESGVLALERSIKIHATSLERYAACTAALHWRHSPYNPDVQRAWKELVEPSNG